MPYLALWKGVLAPVRLLASTPDAAVELVLLEAVLLLEAATLLDTLELAAELLVLLATLELLDAVLVELALLDELLANAP